MALISKTGTVSHVTSSANIYGNNGNVKTVQSFSFRIDGTPATGQISTNVGIHNNDVVTAVGEMKKGTLKVYGLKNQTSGAYIEPSVVVSLIAGGCFIILGLLTLVFLVGFVLLPVGIYMVYEGIKARRVIQMLNNI